MMKHIPIPIHQLFFDWSQAVGPIFTCYFGSQRWIVLNSIDIIKDLVVDRGSIYSSRNLPDTLVHDFMQGDDGGGFAFFPYGTSWRRLRRIAHTGLVKSKIDIYQPILDERRTILLSHLYQLTHTNLKEGVSLSHLLEHYTMTSILAIAYGDMCSFEPGDPVLRKAFAITERAANTMGPSDQIREFFPILKTLWPVKREKYLKVRQDFGDFYGGLLDQFKSQYSDQDCFVKDIVALDQLTDLQIRNFIGIFVGAGSDTTTSTLEWLIAFLANNLDVQEKAYSEIIDSVGLNRLPGSQDESRLPYIQCIILETLRLRPPAPVAIPHSTTQDDAYRNWLIPKDTIVVMNLYAVHNDPIRFPQPTLFQPDRHFDYVLNQSKKFGQTVEDRPHLSFSTGRRVCVGIHLAERNLFMAVSMLLACFKFERLTDQLIDTETARDVRAPTWTPMHYRIRLVPRHEGVRHLF
ncbi:hypothetical protein MFLAVUS_005301 [Mucor flavus]|uniref:Cytochrome P450 n=1 Tax=Mucor flavus TaxID=439312 RepID=A0ABP9YYA4_9FUNG